MPANAEQPVKMESRENCGVCGAALIYGTDSVSRKCDFCGYTYDAMIYCPRGHYICDSCHRADTIAILKQVANNTTSANPLEILESVMQHPSVPMHGPEHHSAVPVAILVAVKNSGYTIPDGAVEKALTRGGSVPGGWCGFHGACGAAIGVGIAISILTGATPLSGKQRSLANKATASALLRIVDDEPRCCKRSSRKAIEAAIDFLQDNLGIRLEHGQPLKCHYFERNRQCPKEACVYYQGV